MTTAMRLTVELDRPANADRRRAFVPDLAARGGDEIAALFSTGRRRDDAGTRRFVGTPSFDARASATAWIVAEGLSSLDSAARGRVVDGWRDGRPCPASLVVDGGCDVSIGDVTLGVVARTALLHWLPLSQLELTLLDSGLFADDPAGAIALLLRPPTIWPLEDAVRARMLLSVEPGFDPERFATLEKCALPRVDRGHLARLRTAVRRIEGQLPARGASTASATIAAGCAALAADEARSRAVAARQLARYAASRVAASQHPRSAVPG